MKKFLLKILFVFSFLSIFGISYAQDIDWLIKKSDHFIIYYESEPHPGYIKTVIRQAEKYYDSITEKLGFRRFDFWRWDERCEIFLYLSKQNYYNDTKQPVWSGGEVNIKKRQISTYIGGDNFLNSVLPHEMGHLVFREFIGYKKKVPLWLDEGVAVISEGRQKSEERLKIAKRLVKSNLYMPLDKLTNIKDAKTIVLPNAFYAQSTSLVYFLLETRGKRKFFYFCSKLKDNISWKRALDDIYGFESLKELNDAWVKFLLN